MRRHVIGKNDIFRQKSRADTHLYRRRVRLEASPVDGYPMPRIVEAHRDSRIAARRENTLGLRILLHRDIFEELAPLCICNSVFAVRHVCGTAVRISHGRCVRQCFDTARTVLARVAITYETHDRRAVQRQRDGSARTADGDGIVVCRHRHNFIRMSDFLSPFRVARVGGGGSGLADYFYDVTGLVNDARDCGCSSTALGMTGALWLFLDCARNDPGGIVVVPRLRSE